MFWIFLILASNSVLSTDQVNNSAVRIVISGLPINLSDVFIVITLIFSVLPKGKSYVMTRRTHPLFIWSMVLFGLAFVVGMFGGASNGATSGGVVKVARNQLEVPLLIYIGYRFFRKPTSSIWFLRMLTVVAVVTAFIICINFQDKAAAVSDTGGKFESIRVVQYNSTFPATICAFLIYSLATGFKPVFRFWITLPLAAGCFVGAIAPLSRSDWLGLTAALIVCVAAIQRFGLATKIGYTIIVVPILTVTLMIAMALASTVSGKDVGAKMYTRFLSMLPGDYQDSSGPKAWETRLAGSNHEFQLWGKSPIIGNGFAIQMAQPDWQGDGGYYHNCWASTLADTGLIGFSAFASLFFGLIVIGWRMAKARSDRYSALIGGLAAGAGALFALQGYATMLWNQVRGASLPAIIFGVMLRMRQMQLEHLTQESTYSENAANLAYGNEFDGHELGEQPDDYEDYGGTFLPPVYHD